MAQINQSEIRTHHGTPVILRRRWAIVWILFIRRGMLVLRARKWICVVSCTPMLAGIPAALVSNPLSALAYICVALLGYASWSTMGLTFASDLFSSHVVGSVTGLSGLGAGLVSTLFTLAVGLLVDHFSYLHAFVVAALAPVLATVSVLFLIRKTPAVFSPEAAGGVSL